MSDESVTVKVTDDTFELEVARAPGPVLVNFRAEWCGPCRAVAPALEALAADYAGRLKVTWVDVDQNPALSRQYGIRALPTLVFFHQGQVTATLTGAHGKRQIEDAICDAVS